MFIPGTRENSRPSSLDLVETRPPSRARVICVAEPRTIQYVLLSAVRSRESKFCLCCSLQ